ncbi:hypothetical protein C900_05177 [Fulvivirga imtechensis AK7]|uniref:Uncharacterized protein n=1 Tax=Fulvivirga imtechensis AK7 TaxID=1237149 RepID=L8JM60_9BACT|nr:hypothetical protein C900_05177 [Fulvivirga imtechensis AK7]
MTSEKSHGLTKRLLFFGVFTSETADIQYTILKPTAASANYLLSKLLQETNSTTTQD